MQLFQKAQDANDSMQERNLRITTIPLKVALGAGLIVVIIYALGDSGDGQGLNPLTALRMVGMSLFIAGAFFGLGLLLGFIFGVPRSAQENAAPPTGGTAEGDSRQRLKVNTNLEQISDWLTKILVGVGLTQLSDIPSKLAQLATFVASGLAKGAPTDPVNGTSNDLVFALGVVLYFFICGFFCGYLLTRLFLAGAFLVADNMSEETVRKVQEMKGEVESLRMEVYATPSTKALQPVAEQGAAQGLPTWQTLVQQYNEVRRTQSAGESRTRVMSKLFAQMCALAATLEDHDPRSQLQEKDGGSRLFAYAYLLSHPKPELLSSLLDAVTNSEETNFGQYRGIQSIEKVLASAPLDATAAEVRRLESFLLKLPSGTDRRYELRRILDEHRDRRKQAA